MLYLSVVFLEVCFDACAVQDAMAICRHGSRPDLFLTKTCNPNWKEIVDNLLPGQTATMRPDLVARVFKGKLQALLDELKEDQIFGRNVARLYVIEFQKRGLPHAHILISFAAEDKLHGPDDFDSVVSAQLPDKKTHPLLYALVCRHMLHKECWRDHPDARCMRDGKCRFDYPKPFAEETTSTEDACSQYARYAQLQNGCPCVVYATCLQLVMLCTAGQTMSLRLRQMSFEHSEDCSQPLSSILNLPELR